MPFRFCSYGFVRRERERSKEREREREIIIERPGPIFTKILDAIKDEQLEQKITTREDALKKAKELSAE